MHVLSWPQLVPALAALRYVVLRLMGDVTFAGDRSLTRVDNDMRSQRVTSLRRRALDSLLLLRRVLGDDRRGD